MRHTIFPEEKCKIWKNEEKRNLWPTLFYIFLEIEEEEFGIEYVLHNQKYNLCVSCGFLIQLEIYYYIYHFIFLPMKIDACKP